MTKSNYPFTEQSSRELAPEVLLPRGIILGCLLTPKTADVVNYGRVSKIYCDKITAEGLLEISSDTQQLLCTVRFLLDPSQEVLCGYAYDINGDACGCITARTALLPFFYSEYMPGETSLIFTPSVLRILNVNTTSSSACVEYNGREVRSLLCEAPPAQPAEQTNVCYVSEIRVNDKVTLKGPHVAITTDCGGLRVHKSGNILKMGRFCESYE